MASEQRLHPLSILFSIAGQLGNFLLPAAVLIFSARRLPWDTWLLLFTIPTALYGVVRYLTFRYAFEPDELVIRSGLLFKNERHIRYDRIQNIETVRNVLHRLLGVADARIQTAGGSEPEARLQVLSLGAIDDMRRRVFVGRAGVAPAQAAEVAAGAAPGTLPAVASVPAAEPQRTLVRLGLRDLIVFGLVENRGVLVIAAAMGVLWEMQSFRFEPGDRFSLVGEAVRFVMRGDGLSSLASPGFLLRAAAIVAALVVVVRVLSVGWAIVRLYNFTLARVGDELRTTCGLFTEVRSAIPLRRIQLITVSEAPLQRLFGRVTVRVQTAGGDAEANVTREWLAPVLSRAQLGPLLAQVLPEQALAATDWRPVHPHAIRRLLRGWLWTSLFVLLPALFVFKAWGLALLPPLLTLSWLGARGQARGYRYALGAELVGFRSGWLWTHTSIAPSAKLQNLALEHSPWDRRWRMATVSGDTAGGGSHRITIPYLPETDAATAFDSLRARIASTAFRW